MRRLPDDRLARAASVFHSRRRVQFRRAANPVLVALATLAGLTYALALTGAPATRAAPAAAWPPPTAESPCLLTHNKIASPDTVLLGETVDITLTVRATCPGEQFSLHLAFVMDASGSMIGQPERMMQTAAARLVRSLDLDGYPATKAAVAEFNDDSRRLCSLSNDENRVIKAISRVDPRSSGTPPARPPRSSQPDGNTRIEHGIYEGLRALQAGRRERDIDTLTQVMIVLSDGRNDQGCPAALNAARKARGQGVLVIAVCVGPECDERCMRDVASGPRYYFRAENAGGLQSVFDRIRDRILNIKLRKLEVIDTLPDWVEYVPDSAYPPQSSPDAPDRWLEWQDVYVPRDGVTYALKIKPLKTGTMPTNLEATGFIVDNRGRGKTWAFDVPWITVLAPTPAAISLVTATPRAIIAPATAAPASGQGR